jgi:glycosyltransferase involved in cell wall biosynthesis
MAGTTWIMRDVKRERPVLVYLVTEDWYFLSHRLPMAIAAKPDYEVHVATHVNHSGQEIEEYGFRLHPLLWRRGSLNPLRLFSIVRAIRKIYRTYSPDIVHHVALQPAIIGSLAAIGLPIIRLNALAGLGYGFTSQSIKARILRPVLTLVLRILLNGRRAAVLVQNPDDRTAILALGVSPDRVFLIPGSGVDVRVLRPLQEPNGPITVAYIGRLLDDKGLRTLVAAHDILARRGQKIRLLIGGESDPANPASIPSAEIESWKRHPGIEVLGNISEIAKFWSSAHIAVLPSRREGLPKSLLEAAACARPIVATDVPGCREIARHGVNALLVPPDNAQALADAISLLANDKNLRRRFGDAGRRLVESEYAAERVGADVVALYDRLLAQQR